jgi:serine/threonine protein kinase
MSGKCIPVPRARLLILSLLYLHTGNPMQGISHPILWKASPSRTEIAIVSRCNEGEQSLAQRYLQIPPNSTYNPLAVPDLCSLAIKVVQVLGQIHSKRVRHGGLRPDVIGIWFLNGEPQVCLRDFTESRLLGDNDTPIEGSSAGELLSFNTSPSICLHYMSPEVIGGDPGSSLFFK